MATFNPDKCRQRRFLAAARDGVEATPFAFLPSPELSVEDALARINERHDGPALSADDVWIHYAEAANDTFIADRFAFLSADTLRNMAADSNAGISFMNSHRTGGLSAPAELPFGKTFMGAFQEAATSDGPRRRCVVGMYMLRDIRPNGEAGPSTDDIHRQIEGGVIRDVSVGFVSGYATCDVCGREVNDANCQHTPGTHGGMTEAETAAQMARGVARGCASYTIQDGHIGEVSAVYDGAVPGAGFRKFRAQAHLGQLSTDVTAEARHAYSALMGRENHMDTESGIIAAIREGFANLGERLGLRPSPPPVEDSEPEPSPDVTAELAAATAERDHLAAKLAKLDEERMAAEEAQRQAEAEAFYEAQFTAGKATPAMHDAVVAVFLSTPDAARALFAESAIIVPQGESGFSEGSNVPAAIQFTSLAAFLAASPAEKSAAVKAYQAGHNLSTFNAADAALRAELGKESPNA